MGQLCGADGTTGRKRCRFKVTAKYYAIDVLFSVNFADLSQAGGLRIIEYITKLSQLNGRQTHTIRTFHWVCRISIFIFSAVYYLHYCY